VYNEIKVQKKRQKASKIYTSIKIVRLSVTVGDRGKRHAARGWLGVLGVVDTRFGQPASSRR